MPSSLNNSPQNINYIANSLLAKGCTKEAILGVLVNMAEESGWWPYADEKTQLGGTFYYYAPGATSHGYGLVQYSWQPIAKNIYDYNHAGHSETECIEHELGILMDEMGLNASTGASWLSRAPYYVPTIQDFWKNTKGLTARQCAIAWHDQFERSQSSNGGSRYDMYINTVQSNIEWGANVGQVGGGSVSPSGPSETTSSSKKEQQKLLTAQDCLNFLDLVAPKQSHTNADKDTSYDPSNPAVTPPASGSGSTNIQAVWDMYNSGVGTVDYFLGYLRNDWPYYQDCSSFVSRCVATYLGIAVPNPAPNTETLHAWLTGLGYYCRWEGNKYSLPTTWNEADVIIMGQKGSSIGGAGHTVFVMDSSGTTIEASGSCPDTKHAGLGQSNARRQITWVTATSPYWYVYSRR